MPYSLTLLEDRITTTSGALKAQLDTKNHGTLVGLADDDHTQYHNDFRGNQLYPRRSMNETISGSWTLNTKLTWANYTNSTPADGDRWKQSDNDFRVRSGSQTFIDATNSMIQCQHATGATRIEVNSTPAAITWNSEDVKDAVYTHDNLINPSRITVGATAWYKVTYSVGWESDALKKTVGSALRKNGTTYLTPGQSYSQTQTNKDDSTINFSSSLHRLTSGDYIEVMASGVGSSGSAYTLQDGSSYIFVEFVRWSN